MRILKALAFLAPLALLSSTPFAPNTYAVPRFGWEDVYYISSGPEDCTNWTEVGRQWRECDLLQVQQQGTLDGYLKVSTKTDCDTGQTTEQWYTKVCGCTVVDKEWKTMPPGAPCIACRMC